MRRTPRSSTASSIRRFSPLAHLSDLRRFYSIVSTALRQLNLKREVDLALGKGTKPCEAGEAVASLVATLTFTPGFGPNPMSDSIWTGAWGGEADPHIDVLWDQDRNGGLEATGVEPPSCVKEVPVSI